MSFRPSVTSGEISANKENKKSSLKIYALILSIIFLFTALVGGSVFLIVNHINKVNASTESPTFTTNVFNTNGTINKTGTYALLDAVKYTTYPNDTGYYTAHNIANRGSNNSGKTIIFPMGYYTDSNGNMDTSKPIYWQATYLWNNYLTIWMSSAYTLEYFISGSATLSGFGNGTNYTLISNYSKSTIRDVCVNIFNKLNSNLLLFNDIVKSPSEANATWQKTQAEGVSTNFWGTPHHNSMYSYNGSYDGWDNSNWDSANPPYNDKFWLPSAVEVCENSNDSTTIGIWKLNSTDRAYNTTTIKGDETADMCWLRSGNTSNTTQVTCIRADNDNGYAAHVSNVRGVRLACHISLKALKDSISYSTIDFDQQGGSGGTTTIEAAFNAAMPSITPPTRTGYIFAGYFSEVNGGGTRYYNTDGTSATTYLEGGATTLYAQWLKKTVQVSYNAGSGTVSGKVYEPFWSSNLVYVMPANATVPVIMPATGLAFEVGQTYMMSFTYIATGNIGFDVDFHPDTLPQILPDATTTEQLMIWEFTMNNTDCTNCNLRIFNDRVIPTTHEVMVANVAIYKVASSTTQDNKFMMYGNNYEFPTATIGDVSMEFDAWYKESTFTNKVTSSTSISNANAHTLYAKYKKRSISISVTPNISEAGEVLGNGVYDYVTQVTIAAMPEIGYTLLYWIHFDATGNEIEKIYSNVNTILVESNESYMAIFSNSLLSNIACFADGGGEARMSGYGDENITVHFSAVAYAGYTFDGWFIYGETTPLSTDWSVDLEKSAINNKLIVAKFSKISANVNTETSNTDKLT
ncbi:MAG: InlB B-repeat-containing protein [Clostridia bacterium]|nr:InlB B-repeat-containing protein [Clostridia bacterium]